MAPGLKRSPLRLLVLTPSSDKQKSPSPFPPFLEKITGVSPSTDVATFAGYTSHPSLYLKTKYYEAEVGIWCDELPLNTDNSSPISKSDADGSLAHANSQPSPSSEQHPQDQDHDQYRPTLSEWQEQMLSTSAREVRDVIGGIILLFPVTQLPTSKTQQTAQIKLWMPYIEAVNALYDAIQDESGRDVASVVVVQDMTPARDSIVISNKQDDTVITTLLDEIDDESLNNYGIVSWDYISWRAVDSMKAINGLRPESNNSSDIETSTRNIHGEKTGIPRIFEVLEAIDWTTDPSSEDLDLDLDLNSNADETHSIDFLNDTPTSQSLHADIRAVLNESAQHTSDGIMTPSTASLLANEHREFQREMLGLKMAMLEKEGGNSAPSSLAGEFDVGDFGARTPLVRPGATSSGGIGMSRLRSEFSNADMNGVEADGDKKGVGAEGDEGDEMQVEQLSALMQRAIAIREAAEGMTGPEKEKFARREVNRIMKELG